MIEKKKIYFLHEVAIIDFYIFTIGKLSFYIG
jgi:hypothetical protein